MQKTEREVAMTFGLLGPEDQYDTQTNKSPTRKAAHNSHDPNPEVAQEENNIGFGNEESLNLQKFLLSESAEQIKDDELFQKLYIEYYRLLDEAYYNYDYATDMVKEDDNGPIEYKLRLTNLTMEKLRKRTT